MGRFAITIGLILLGAVNVWAQGRQAEDGATVEDAQNFIQEAEEELLQLWIEASRAAWVQNTYITQDTEILSAKAQEKVIGATMELAKESTRFDGLQLPYDVQRKIDLLKTSMAVAAPSDPDKQAELTRITTAMEGIYGRGEYCPPGVSEDEPEEKQSGCLDLNQMSRILAESRDPERLLDIWRGWRTISPPMRPMYQRFVELSNEGARELGFADLGALWRSGYDMPPQDFAAEVERLWQQVKPLYDSLHCHVRAKLSEHYGSEVVAQGEPLPAHLLGNMWSQSWGNIYELVKPEEDEAGFNLTELLGEKKVDEREMVRYGENFFTSLGFAPLPETFWDRSQFTKPADRDVVCHASAWDIDQVDDLRIKMCIEITGEDFQTIHHELGHNFYQRAYNQQSPLYRDSANDGFHEAVGDTIALSITPYYLTQVDLLDEVPEETGDLGELMKMALDKVAFLPFGLLIDQWRWKVFSGEIAAEDYNKTWWELRRNYQGIHSVEARGEEFFDPGAKYHVPFNTPYTRYFLAHILQFQFHRALCREAAAAGPLHGCSIYKSKEAGTRLMQMLEMGKSRPWSEALEALTGERSMDATAILDYFAPLKKWLDQQNQGRTCGW